MYHVKVVNRLDEGALCALEATEKQQFYRMVFVFLD